MKICIIILNDGRNDYLEQTLKSLDENLIVPIGSEVYKILYDDMPEGRDEETISRIALEHKIDRVILSDKNNGIDQAVQNVWKEVPECDYVWHQENDFTYNEKIFVADMIRPLELNRMIGQVALQRQAWYDDEIEAGSMYKVPYRSYRHGNIAGINLVFQDMFFTHNPCIYRYSSIAQVSPYNELAFAEYLKKKGIKTFAYLGKLTDAPKVHHIGVIKK